MLMRSKLFVPGSRPELFEKAMLSPADALSFDLEDAVAESRKDEARQAVAAFLSTARPGKIIVVRVNAPGTPHHTADMAAIALPRLDLVNLPMIEEPGAIVDAATLLDRADPERRIRLLINIETPRALRRAAELAAAHPRVAGLQVGYGDLFEPHGIDRMDRAALDHVRLAVRLAAAEAGVFAVDGAYANVADNDGYRAECEAARRQGYAGKSCIHPSQVPLANTGFLPGAAEVDRARRILQAAAAAEAQGVGAYMVDGRMVDGPFVAGARAIVALADRALPAWTTA